MTKKIDAVDPAGSSTEYYYDPWNSYYYKKYKAERLPEDTVQIGESAVFSAVYSGAPEPKSYTADIASIKRKAQAAADNLRALVERLAAQQKLYLEIAAKRPGSFSEARREKKEKTEDADSEKKIYDIEAVSDRIVNFARSQYGDDEIWNDEIKAVVGKGFEDAEQSFGGKLPDICRKTYDKIMKKLDAVKR